MAVALALDVWAESGDAPSTRGSTSPGAVEAYWKLDETTGGVALDSSGHGLNGSFRNQPKRVAGVRGGAVQLDGKAAYIDFGHATAFRLKGSMTLSAWIHPSSFPVDDAAIVSTLIGGELGYQLDTTVDRGPRTIGFKLADACGNLMARYGKTVLAAGSWYHVAGVYDAEARTLDVYLNGRRDDGFLAGSVASSQRSARGHLYVGRRSGIDGNEFAGSIDDVHIYSFAMTQEEIVMDMHGTAPTAFEERGFHRASAAGNSVARAGGRSGVCAASSEPEDARIAGAAAAFGVLVAVASVGLWPSAGPFLWAFIAFATGMVLFPAVVSFTMPAVSRWMLPFLSLAGGLSVAASVRR